MRQKSAWLRTAGLVLAAFAGGAAASHFAHATTQASSPYAPFDQLARVLVLVENEYVEPAQRNKIIEGAIKGMVAELDPHSAYMNPEEFALFQSDTEGSFGGVGVEVDVREELVTVIAPMDGSPAERAGIRSGDQILAINGTPMRGERIDKIVTWMRGPVGTKVRVTIRRAGVPQPLIFDLVREQIRVSSVVAKRLERNVGYLRLKQFQAGTHDELLRAAAKLRAESKEPLAGILLDMRFNPGGLVDEAEAVADEFLSAGVIYSTRHHGKILSEAKATFGGAFASLPVVTLVNEYSASSAELVAGALQDSRRSTIVGAVTFGKGSVQTIFGLPGGAGLRLTTMRYYTPSGRSIQAEGIRPDFLIEQPDSGPASSAEVVRERDLTGHLPSEVDPGVSLERPSVVVNSPPPQPKPGGQSQAAGPTPVPSRDVPTNPTNGSDVALSVGYQLLLKTAVVSR